MVWELDRFEIISKNTLIVNRTKQEKGSDYFSLSRVTEKVMKKAWNVVSF